MTKIYIFVMLTVFIAACGGAGGGGSSVWKVKYKGKDVPFEVKTSASSIRPDLSEGQLVIANYDIEIKDKSVMGVADPEKAGQVLVGVYFKNNDPKDFKDSVRPGDFSDKIKYVWVANGDTKDRVTFSEGGAAVPGKLTITEVTGETIKGTMEITKGDTTISGPFEAKILSKHL